jgi:hypothetical protein
MMSRIASRVVVALAAAVPFCVSASPAGAQRPDSTRRAVQRPQPQPASSDTIKPPISPRRAFFLSFLIPGSAQTILGRNKAAALLMLFEGVTISMIRESGADIREARRTVNDTIVVSWRGSSGNTQATTPVVVPPRFDNAYVAVRRSHQEDWIAVLIANHLFAGADAYVAANLWDVPTQLSVRSGPTGPMIVASIPW